MLSSSHTAHGEWLPSARFEAAYADKPVFILIRLRYFDLTFRISTERLVEEALIISQHIHRPLVCTHTNELRLEAMSYCPPGCFENVNHSSLVKIT